jgi:hypothetical protein
MPAPTRSEAFTATEPPATAARLTFESAAQAICKTAFSPSKRRATAEPEISTAPSKFTSVRSTRTSQSEKEMEAAPEPVRERGEAIG